MNRSPYHRYTEWLKNAKWARQTKVQNTPSFAITLSPELDRETVVLAEDLAEYLNEFDENAAGNWTVYDHEALREISQLGGLDDLPKWIKRPSGLVATTDAESTYSELLCGMVQLGTIVVVENQAYLATQQIPRVFHVHLTDHAKALVDDTRPFHVLMNTNRFGSDSMVNIIGDSALEWASRGHDPMDRVTDFVR